MVLQVRKVYLVVKVPKVHLVKLAYPVCKEKLV